MPPIKVWPVHLCLPLSGQSHICPVVLALLANSDVKDSQVRCRMMGHPDLPYWRQHWRDSVAALTQLFCFFQTWCQPASLSFSCQDHPTVSSFLWQPLSHCAEPGHEANMKCKAEPLQKTRSWYIIRAPRYSCA